MATHRIIALILSLIGCGTMVVSANEKAERILQWLPAGTYQSITHRDVATLAKARSWTLFHQYFEKDSRLPGVSQSRSWVIGRIPEDYTPWLPQAFHDQLQNSTTAEFLSLAETPEKLSGVDKLTFKNSEVGAPAVAIMVRGNLKLEVYEIVDLDELLAAAAKAGSFMDSGKSISGRPVYLFRELSDRRVETRRHVWNSGTGELLAAGSFEALREMVLAGEGERLGLLDDVDCADLIQLIPDLGPKWRVTFIAGVTRKTADVAENRNLSAEQVEKMRADAEKKPLMFIRSWEPDEVIHSRSIAVYLSSSSAEAAFREQPKDSFAPYRGKNLVFDSFREKLNDRTKRTLEGNLIVTTMSYDKSLLEEELAASDALVAVLKKEQAEQRK